jgi:hypothetical protein
LVSVMSENLNNNSAFTHYLTSCYAIFKVHYWSSKSSRLSSLITS